MNQVLNEVNLENFAAFILCHGRPDNTPTFATLRKYGYTGNIYMICDDEDSTLIEYINKYGEDSVRIFSKSKIVNSFDLMDNLCRKNCAVYARNACFEIAKNLGIRYFCELDDDYREFQFRYASSNQLKLVYPTNLDDIFLAAIEFLNCDQNIMSVAFGQGGDFIGGINGHGYKNKLKRKCMNSWICDVNKPFIFNGTMNDDVNTYTLLGSRGKLFFTLDNIMINQPDTQSVRGGMTDMYVGDGTYQKSFYTVMQCPSFVKVGMMGAKFYRCHHHINWKNAVPKIISDRYKRR